MAIKDLIKLNGESETANLPARREQESSNSPASLQREMTQWMSQWNRLFDSFFGRAFGLTPWEGQGQGQDWTMTGWRAFSPAVNVSENEREVRVTAELPGIDPKSIDLWIDKGTLTIAGEKKEEQEEKGEGYHRVERSYGSFRRVLPLPEGVDTEQVDAQFKNGVLTLVMPKLPEEQTGKKKITIKS